MNYGDLFTRLTIWLAIAGYATGAAMLLLAGEPSGVAKRARCAWTIGGGFFIAHVVCAFAYFHHWSHLAAVRETARQTGELTGWQWGGGLYFNYVLAAAWLVDVLWWWLAPGSFAGRPRWLTALWQGFFFFMVFNGTVVFGRGPVRWLGVIVCGGLAALWWRAAIATRSPND